MPKQMDVEKMLDLDRQFFGKLGQLAIELIEVRTRRGYGVRGRKLYKFPDYTLEYAEAKKRGMTRKSNRAGRRGTKYANLTGQSVDRQVDPPNFELRGKTMDDLSKNTRTGRNFVDIGWRGEFATIVAAHEDLGKFVVPNLSDKEHDELLDLADKKIEENWNRKVKSVTVRVK